MADATTHTSGPPPVDPEVKARRDYGKRKAASMEAQARMSVQDTKRATDKEIKK